LSLIIAHLRGTTVKFVNTITDFGDPATLIDPDTHEITIYDSQDDLQETVTNPAKASAGVYFVYYTIPDDGAVGTWRLDWKATKGNLPSKARLQFSVAA
jgi:hypothetical protein